MLEALFTSGNIGNVGNLGNTLEALFTKLNAEVETTGTLWRQMQYGQSSIPSRTSHRSNAGLSAPQIQQTNKETNKQVKKTNKQMRKPKNK